MVEEEDEERKKKSQTFLEGECHGLNGDFIMIYKIIIYQFKIIIEI